MKINTKLQVVAAEGVEKAVASELEVEDDDLEKLLAQSEATDETEDTEDNPESL